MTGNFERTGWRDHELSLRHRTWGPCHMADLDFLANEYNFGKPVALIEYKFQRRPARPTIPDLSASTYRAHSALADGCSIPFVLAFYWRLPWSFAVFPVNAIARRLFGGLTPLTELEYVTWQHRLRSISLEHSLAAVLDDEAPPFESEAA